MSYDQSKVAFIDTETSGLDPELHGIWDIAVIVDGVEHTWQQRLPGGYGWQQYADPWVLENTRILQDYDSKAALPCDGSSVRLAGLVEGRHLVGACTWFDAERLHRTQLLWQPPVRTHPWHYHLIDIENLMVGFMAGVNDGIEYEPHFPPVELPWSSRELSRLLGVNPDDFLPAHTAITDARWAKAVFEVIMGGPQ